MKAYSEFRKIIGQRLRLVGLFLGHDVFSDDFKIHSYTVILLGLAWTYLIFLVSTAYYYDGALQLIAIATFGHGIKVLQI